MLDFNWIQDGFNAVTDALASATQRTFDVGSAVGTYTRSFVTAENAATVVKSFSDYVGESYTALAYQCEGGLFFTGSNNGSSLYYPVNGCTNIGSTTLYANGTGLGYFGEFAASTNGTVLPYANGDLFPGLRSYVPGTLSEIMFNNLRLWGTAFTVVVGVGATAAGAAVKKFRGRSTPATMVVTHPEEDNSQQPLAIESGVSHEESTASAQNNAVSATSTATSSESNHNIGQIELILEDDNVSEASVATVSNDRERIRREAIAKRAKPIVSALAHNIAWQSAEIVRQDTDQVATQSAAPVRMDVPNVPVYLRDLHKTLDREQFVNLRTQAARYGILAAKELNDGFKLTLADLVNKERLSQAQVETALLKISGQGMTRQAFADAVVEAIIRTTPTNKKEFWEQIEVVLVPQCISVSATASANKMKK